MKDSHTQRVVKALKSRALTYFGMIEAAGTPHAHRRALEWIERTEGWRIDKKTRPDGVITWRIVKA
jgi:hypothetical protein